MMNRKSQAALEFIMTYGWAILVVLVAIGALAYFGVLSPDRFLPNKCTLQSGIACTDFKATSGSVIVHITNSLGQDLDTVVIGAGDCGNSGAGVTLANGASSTFTVTCNPVLTGSKYNAQLNVSYVVTDTSVSHNNVGQITARLE
ncbi:MAG TPA: hypothetical protein VI564_07235 [Candidatus Nanoarchaeia archaeon]|nr:hypothetical protein [Candidatus Nanoarchaeia archaeon]